jgi:hypothetical protein
MSPGYIILVVIGSALIGIPASADETWSNPSGTAVYEDEIGEIAIFSIPMGTGRARLYLEGLGGNYDKRSRSHGYWIGPEKGSCSAALTTPDQLTSSNWGRVTIVFDKPAFPTGWTAKMGTCFGRKTIEFRANLE